MVFCCDIIQAMRKNSRKKKTVKHTSSIPPIITTKSSVSHARSVIVWSLILVAVFVVLSIVASYSDSDEPKSPFQKKLAEVATLNLLSDEEPLTLIATGDILPARFVERRMRQAGDYTLPFKNTAEFLKNADITFGNLETPLLHGKNTSQDSVTFRGDPESLKGLLFAGFDILSIANNHTMNYQIPGLTSTIQELKKAGILYAGGGKNIDAAHTPAMIKAKDKKIAFYAYVDPNIGGYLGLATWNSPGIAKMDIEAVKNDVKNGLDPNWHAADMVIVSMHTGKEYTRQPTQFQKDFAHSACDAGASLVIGHHPHWVQPVEYYGDCIIFYSLGNFVFDQMWSEETQIGLVAKVSFDEDEKPTAELFPVRMEKTVPRILEGEEREKVMKRIGL